MDPNGIVYAGPLGVGFPELVASTVARFRFWLSPTIAPEIGEPPLACRSWRPRPA
jgi:hypothetical protein